MVGLANVDNTRDLAKPISTATQNALNLKAPLASPALTGVISNASNITFANATATTISADKSLAFEEVVIRMEHQEFHYKIGMA